MTEWLTVHESKAKFSGCEGGTWGGKGGDGREGEGSARSHMHGLGGIGVGLDSSLRIPPKNCPENPATLM